MTDQASSEQITRYADMFAAMGTDSRLRIVQLLLSAHPDGMVAGEIQAELGISSSNLSHHLDKLKNEGLVDVTRLADLLARIKGRIRHAALDHLSPFSVPMMLEIGQQRSPGGAGEMILTEAAETLIAAAIV